jgi:hypothetical protein
MGVLRVNRFQFSGRRIDSVGFGIKRYRVNTWLGWQNFFDFVGVGRVLANDG